MKILDHEIYSVNSFPYDSLYSIPFTRARSKNHPARYRLMTCAFDIETTRIPGTDQAVMYVWQFCANGLVCVGRSWKEYRKFIRRLTAGMKEEEYIIVFVHNLGYEFQFLRSVFKFEDDSVFIASPRQPLYARTGRIEYRCSWKQTNLSLDALTRLWKVPYPKRQDFDYEKLRFPWTPLTESEMEYIVCDVIGLTDSIAAEMRHEGDQLDTLPLTSTGYTRRVLRRNMKTYPLRKLKEIQPDLEIFLMLNEAFRGGNCHANRYYVGEIVRDAKSVDEASAYPTSQCNDLYPMGKWSFETRPRDIKFLLQILKEQKRAFVARVSFRDIHLRRPDWGCPYLSRDKCRKLYCIDQTRADHMYDNGRILFADYLETTITDVDLRIILDEYEFRDIDILDIAHCRYGPLPDEWIETNIKYYKDKTNLKGVEGQEVYYALAKARLNAIYGDTVQNPMKVREVWKNGDYADDTKTLQERLYINSLYPYKSFAWGVWCTSWARYRLEEGIKLAHNALDPETGMRFNGFLYADTDSVKYLGDLPELEQLNDERRIESWEHGAYADDPAGVRHYMGIFEPDGEYEEFKTLGAKKYAYREHGKLKITIAGVNKKLGAEELEEAGGLDSMYEGFTFQKAGGLESVYNDKPAGFYREGKHKVWISSNLALKPSKYQIGLAADYKRILEDPEIYLYIFDKRFYNVV